MVLKILHIILLASVKYIVTLPYAMLIGLEFKYAILAVWAGGIGGFLGFYYLSKTLERGWHYLFPCLCRIMPAGLKKRYQTFCERRAKRKVFSKKSRRLIHLKNTYGLWGIIIATPVLLTIPIGAFLANRYFSHTRHIVLYMILSIVGWGALLSGLIHLFPGVFL